MQIPAKSSPAYASSRGSRPRRIRDGKTSASKQESIGATGAVCRVRAWPRIRFQEVCFGVRIRLWHRAVKHEHIRQHATRANAAAGECVSDSGVEVHPAGGDVAEDTHREREGNRFERSKE